MLINYVLILITLLLVSGLVLDAGLLEWRQIHLQAAADAAAQEGMYQLARGDSNWATEAKAQSTFNGFTNGANSVTISVVNPPISGTYLGNTLAVQATVSQNINNFFMSFVKGGTSTIAASAVAKEIPTCIWIMNPTGPPTNGGTFWLLSASISANCGAYVNTTTNYSITIDGFSGLGTLRTRVVGSSAGNGSSGYVSPKPIFGAAPKNDPLAYVTQPTISSCTYTSQSLSGGSFTIGPATYCGGTTISSTTVTLTAGTYIFADGLTISNSTIYGTSGVTLYFTKHNSGSYTNVTVQHSALYLKAPVNTSAGGIPGVLVFTDRNWISHGNQGISLNSDGVTADGIWYMPNIGLNVQNNTFNRYKYDVWVIDNLYHYSSSSYFGADYSDFTGSISPLHYEDGVLAQ